MFTNHLSFEQIYQWGVTTVNTVKTCYPWAGAYSSWHIMYKVITNELCVHRILCWWTVVVYKTAVSLYFDNPSFLLPLMAWHLMSYCTIFLCECSKQWYIATFLTKIVFYYTFLIGGSFMVNL